MLTNVNMHTFPTADKIIKISEILQDNIYTCHIKAHISDRNQLNVLLFKRRPNTAATISTVLKTSKHSLKYSNTINKPQP